MKRNHKQELEFRDLVLSLLSLRVRGVPAKISPSSAKKMVISLGKFFEEYGPVEQFTYLLHGLMAKMPEQRLYRVLYKKYKAHFSPECWSEMGKVSSEKILRDVYAHIQGLDQWTMSSLAENPRTPEDILNEMAGYAKEPLQTVLAAARISPANCVKLSKSKNLQVLRALSRNVRTPAFILLQLQGVPELHDDAYKTLDKVSGGQPCTTSI